MDIKENQMNDPIKDILRKLDTEMAQAVAAGSAKGLGGYDEAAKQIRQQIGRELLEKETVIESRGINNGYSINYVSSLKIREVCQLEEQDAENSSS